MARPLRFAPLFAVTFSLSLAACDGGGDAGSGAGGQGGSGAGSTTGGGGSGGAEPSGDRTLVLVGGGTDVCTSAATASCAGSPSFPQQTDLPLKTGAGELYDLHDDPEQMDNVFAERPAVVQELTGMLRQRPRDQSELLPRVGLA